jgi:ATP-binding protein involved in chromosome partitioning
VITIEDVRERLSEIRPPGLKQDIMRAGMVREVKLEGDRVSVDLLAGPLPDQVLRVTVEEIEKAVGAFDGVASVDVRVITPQAQGAAGEIGPLPGIAEIVAVSSTKGGVGKSTVSVNLACAMVGLGRRVGLLDADVYGPSLPTMLGLSGRPQVVEQSKVMPLEKYGLRVMSMGFFLDDTSPVIWRGPLVTGLLRQFLKDVQWGELDVLLIDLPPGTGDAQLTLVQQVPISGAVVVTTPQPVSVLDVERGISMFNQVNTPVLGVVENMSFFECPKCGSHDEIFGSGGAARIEQDFGVPVIGRIPLVAEVRASGDAGVPLVVGQPDHPLSRIYREIAERVLGAVARERQDARAPRIVGYGRCYGLRSGSRQE